MKKVVFAVLALSLAGCGAFGIPSMSNTKKNASQEAIEVSCNGFANWEKCDEKAKAFCPKGYDVLTKDENLVAQGRVMRIACE